MFRELRPIELFAANLALDHHFRTLSFDVLEQLGTSHVLEVLVIADVAPELWTVKHGMLLQLPHGLPDDLPVPVVLVALVRELTEVNTVSKYFIDILQEVTSGLAVRAANIESWSCSLSILLLLAVVHCLSVFFSLSGRHLGKLLL